MFRLPRRCHISGYFTGQPGGVHVAARKLRFDRWGRRPVFGKARIRQVGSSPSPHAAGLAVGRG
ncbi:hypothetical protein HMPREF9946_04409 [Acetobacteraceae bacterium AT-5844]|nr:hypothetical protein HMPREF9946_04409 [Acetobacteraceae bacterium AT-5844]